MADVYVRKTGSDSNGGTGPSDAYLTLGKANTSCANGDRIVIGAGKYRATVSFSHTTNTWYGDVDGALTGDSGDVIWSAYLTNDKTAPSNAAPCFNLNAKTGHIFTNILLEGGTWTTGSCGVETTGVATAPVFNNCDFIAGNANGPICDFTITAAGTGPKYNNCSIVGGNGSNSLLRLGLPLQATVDYDCGARYLNCNFLCLASASSGRAIVHYQNGGSSTFKGGGGLVSFCTFYASNDGVFINNNNVSATIPMQVLGNYFLGAQSAVTDNSSRGAIIEDWNIFETVAARTNVPVGLNSIGQKTYAPMLEFWHSFNTGRSIRPFGQPAVNSPLLGFVPLGTRIATGIPATIVNDSTVGTLDWTNPGNVSYPDGTNATAVMAALVVSHYLKVTNFGFNLPSTATVTRVVVRILASQTGSGNTVGNSIKLVKGGVISGNDNSASFPALTGSLVAYDIGGAADLWGLTLLYSDVNLSTFGIALSVKDSSAVNAITMNLDYIMMYVEYTDSATPTEQTKDFTGRPRAMGGASASMAVGAFERGNSMVKTTSPVHGGSFAGSFTGPGYQLFSRNVDASPTTISVYSQYDSNYGSGTKPQLIVLANGERGVTQQTATQVGASGSYEKITTPSFTPTSAGTVTVMLISYAAATGVVQFDDAGT